MKWTAAVMTGCGLASLARIGQGEVPAPTESGGLPNGPLARTVVPPLIRSEAADRPSKRRKHAWKHCNPARPVLPALARLSFR